VTQGEPLLAKLFNILINAVVWEWMHLMRATINNVGGNLAERIAGLFAVFYINDGYIASCNADSYRRPSTFSLRLLNALALP
jgi:hypothetical protein